MAYRAPGAANPYPEVCGRNPRNPLFHREEEPDEDEAADGETFASGEGDDI
jgi:hypothetical protein